MAKKPNQLFADLASLEDARLLRELDETYRQLFTLRLQVATRQLQNVKETDTTFADCVTPGRKPSINVLSGSS